MAESLYRIRPRAFASLAGALLLAAAAQGAAQLRQAPPGPAPVPFTVTIAASSSAPPTPLIKGAFSPSALYDSTIRQVILASNFGKGIGVRASANLVDWSAPPLAVFDETDRGLEVRYASLIGDGDNASVGSGRPWLFYTHEPPGGGWKGSTFMSRRLQITPAR